MGRHKKKPVRYAYKRSVDVLSVRPSGKLPLSSVLSSFSPSAPAVRSVAVPGFIEIVAFDWFCKAKCLDDKLFFSLLSCYVYSVVSADKFFSAPDLAKFSPASRPTSHRMLVKLDKLGLLQPVQTGQKSVNWKQWKQPLTPKKRYMIAVKGNNLLIEYWDYCQQIASNFTLDYAKNLPEIPDQE